MEFNHKRISGTGVQTLSAAIADSERIYTIERLLICNTDTEDITVNLYLDDGSEDFYLLKATSVPQAMTLDFLNGIPFHYRASYALKLSIAASGTPTADIIFNQS
jgi:hypothetical protein